MKLFNTEFGMQLVYFKGGGGGGSSGLVDYPDYMKNWHGDVLDQTGVDTITSSMTDIMNAALGNSPFAVEVAYDPDADITAYEAAIAGFDAIIAGMNEPVEWDALFTQAETSIDGASDAEITADVAAFADELDDEITVKVLPRFEAGMRDINAVVSSAFVIGRSNIEGFRDRDVARHSSKLRLAIVSDRQRLYLEGTSQMMRFLLSKYAWEESYMRTVVEGKRIKIVAKKEETDVNLDIAESDATWDLGVFQHGANLLGSIGSGVVSKEGKRRSALTSALGGGLAGAAAGAMYGAQAGGVTGPQGAAIGAAIGIAASLLMD